MFLVKLFNGQIFEIYMINWVLSKILKPSEYVDNLLMSIETESSDWEFKEDIFYNKKRNIRICNCNIKESKVCGLKIKKFEKILIREAINRHLNYVKFNDYYVSNTI